MFKTVLIANRGCIASRIIRTLKKLGITAVAVYHEDDATSLHVREADQAISLGSGSIANTYLNRHKIIEAALKSGAEAIHPGYGFLSENSDFVAQCNAAGVVFIGPSAEQITLFGLKHKARELATGAGIPLLPGTDLVTTLDEAITLAEGIGYPVMLKTTAGGGGIGMRVCTDEAALREAWGSVKHLGSSFFANDGVFLEKFISRARHIEVQTFGDGWGDVISLGERDCSSQRRNQKVIEETPAPGLGNELRQQLAATAERLMREVNYRSAGTVEFILDADSGDFYFLEVNTRLQVEHGVTELVWGVDLVEWMLLLAAGELPALPDLKAALEPHGHAIQVRLYAEDVTENFRPSPGLLSRVDFPQGQELRIDTWVESGQQVSPLFDPMLAKVLAFGQDRVRALVLLQQALAETTLYGSQNNLAWLRQVLATSTFTAGNMLTATLAGVKAGSHSFTVLQPGTQTTIQDYPGRTGYWDVGVPPSGPMDSLHFRLANRLVGNGEGDAGLEITLNGPVLRFNADASIAVCGAGFPLTLNDQPLSLFEVHGVKAGDVLAFGAISGSGARCYLAVRGGIQCPDYLGSKSTFTLGQFGGHNGRALKVGDVLHLAPPGSLPPVVPVPAVRNPPQLGPEWELRVIYGPHGSPDFFSATDIDTFFAATWEVHFNSSRTGIRLIGPKPEWARHDGGEAGLHPSNIHDNAYAFGTVDFTGDMPVILGPDGPSLGGFVCPATVIQADLWKLGQLTSGSRVRFVPVSIESALAARRAQDAALASLNFEEKPVAAVTPATPVVAETSLAGEAVVVRLAGDQFILIEVGVAEIDIGRRLLVHALMQWLLDRHQSGMMELTPGIRSLQIHYDPFRLPLDTLLALVEQGCAEFSASDDIRIPSRIVHLPLSWDDAACRQAIEKYMQSVREDAPWCPSNLEFIRRINGLPDIEAVREIVFSASWLVMGLGDVYLGAPVATPLDPRHRLVTTKYNPARTWTAENSVGIGGAYLCIYGMEGPGGYQFVGRTLQMWNRYRQTAEFGKPWLLRFFDQIRFYPVSGEELQHIRQAFPLGGYPLQIEESEFDLAEYTRFLAAEDGAIRAFQERRSQAFASELAEWKRTGKLTYREKEKTADSAVESELPPGTTAVYSPAAGSIWTLAVEEGDEVKSGEIALVLESMKMEIDVPASVSGVVKRVLCQQGQTVQAGQVLLWLA